MWTWAIEQLATDDGAACSAHHRGTVAPARDTPESIHLEPWPAYDEAMTLDEVVTVVVQVNGKVRDRLEVPRGEEHESRSPSRRWPAPRSSPISTAAKW